MSPLPPWTRLCLLCLGLSRGHGVRRQRMLVVGPTESSETHKSSELEVAVNTVLCTPLRHPMLSSRLPDHSVTQQTFLDCLVPGTDNGTVTIAVMEHMLTCPPESE